MKSGLAAQTWPRLKAGSRAIALAGAVLALPMTEGAGAAPAPNPPIDPAALTTRGPGGRSVPNLAGFYYLDPSSAFQPRPSRPGPDGLPRAWMNFQGYATNGNTPPPLKPAALEEMRARFAVEDTGDVFDERTMKCKAPLFFDMYAYGEVQDVLQREDELVMISKKERAMPRHILIGGKHPAEDDLAASPNGHAVAHWEGPVLVVDTIGMTDNTWLLAADYLRHSDKLHIVERFSLSADGQVMTIDATIEDPEVFSKPWPLSIKWRKAPLGTEPVEEPCDVDQRGLTPVGR